MTQYNKGFIALFFTLGISSVLMVYVVVSSEKVFEYMQTRQNFTSHRSELEQHISCADHMVNIIIQTYRLPSKFEECPVENISLIRINPETLQFSFEIQDRIFKGTIVRGLISNLESLIISL